MGTIAAAGAGGTAGGGGAAASCRNSANMFGNMWAVVDCRLANLIGPTQKQICYINGYGSDEIYNERMTNDDDGFFLFFCARSPKRNPWLGTQSQQHQCTVSSTITSTSHANFGPHMAWNSTPRAPMHCPST